jgi:hypothetical protein
LAILVLAAVLAPVASASVTPAVTLDQSAGTTAGSTVSLKVNIVFTPGSSTPTDSPKDMALVLPAGLLANASIDGGACLKSATPSAACQVGTGTVMAKPVLAPPPLNLLGPAVPLPVTFDLVAPPASGDLAGLAIMSLGSQLGSTGDVVVDSTTDRSGVGLDIEFTNIPKTYSIAGVSTPVVVSEIDSTFDSLRMPTSCPAPPDRVVVGTDSYAPDSTLQSATAPLTVTGCSGLTFSPGFHVTAAKDPADSGAAIQTDITQGPGEATSRTVVLNLPSTVLTPNAAGVLNGGILCSDSTFATCKTIGSATATSPLYPAALTGKAYLDGPLTSPSIALVFPPPFALTLVGNVNLAANSTTFNNVPDIPLTDLRVNLAGGPSAVFAATCSPTSGTATSTLTSQNGDKTASPAASFTVAGCAAKGTTGGGKKPKPGSGKVIRPKLSSGSWNGLKQGKPTLTFKLAAGRGAPRLAAFSVKLPNGISFVKKGLRKGLALRTAPVKSASLKRGSLVVTLRRTVASLTVIVRPAALKESKALRNKARSKHRRPKSLKLVVGALNAKGQTFGLSLVIRNLHLGK